MRESEKKEGPDKQSGEEKKQGRKCGPFSYSSSSLSLSFHLSFSCVLDFRKSRERRKKEKKKKKKRERKKRKMSEYCPQILSTKIDIILERLYLSLCDHLLGI